MTHTEKLASLEEQIGQWRNYLHRRQSIHAVDIAELEDHLREQVSALIDTGLSSDEAFLVAVKRMGALDDLSREFAREHSERLWKQLVVTPDEASQHADDAPSSGLIAFLLAVAAGILVKLPEFFGMHPETHESFYAHNAPFFVLPLLTAFFVWKRKLSSRTALGLAAGFVAALVFANAYPFTEEGSTAVLSILHMPIVLWVLVGAAYAGGRWNQPSGRMDFIRFSGEFFIYYVLIALGGGLFTAFLMMLFETIGVDAEWFIQSWLIPCGAAGAVLVASWLVEAKQSVIENMAPVLTRLFTPMFAILLVVFLATLIWTGRGVDIERELLIAFDLLLIVVLALLLYSVSARDPQSPPGTFDVLQIVLVVSALVADAVALWAMSERIIGMGFTPNRLAALGVNIILLVNLAWSTVLYFGFMQDRTSFSDLERWQTTYVPVYAAWAAIVVVLFPVVFGYL